MTFVITGRCCADASCVAVCPVDCIHPTPNEPAFNTTEQLYIDPGVCIECSACAEICPVDAISVDDELVSDSTQFLQINETYYSLAVSSTDTPRQRKSARIDLGGLKVAIVGSGPAGAYAVSELVKHRNVEVDVYDRGYAPHGLIRYGVAPDHQSTKKIADIFDFHGARLHLGIEVGTHVTHDELLKFHHAVIYATGAPAGKRLNIPGEELPGSHSAREFVAWYNGDPKFAEAEFNLRTPTAVVIGNGNVALDIARILTTHPDELARTDIADYALAALRASQIEEVVVLGRRGPEQAAYSTSAILGLAEREDIDVVVDQAGMSRMELFPRENADALPNSLNVIRLDIARNAANRAPTPTNRRVRFRFLVTPEQILGDDRVVGIRVVRSDREVDVRLPLESSAEGCETIDAGLVLASVGSSGVPIAGLPFDDNRGLVPNVAGHVIDPATNTDVPGAYVAGWIKRGANGVIGTNRACANETIERLLADYRTGQLPTPREALSELYDLLQHRQPNRIGNAGWSHIDAAERRLGAQQNRPRVKFTDQAELIGASKRPS
jgi:ferredoxin--NADP+ reductase